MKTSTRLRHLWIFGGLLPIALAFLLFGAACDTKKTGSASSSTPEGGSAPATQPTAAAPASASLTKIRVGYIGLTCEAPIFVAYEKGFFKDEGLDAELVKYDWASYRDALGLGKFDITHHLVMYLLKPIEQGMDVKFTAGIHRGCLRVQAGANGEIKTIGDLKGKRIGVPALGTPPHVFATRVLGANGIDPNKEVTWRVFPASELGLALDKGEVDAVATADPIGTLLLSQGKVRNVVDQATDAPYKDEYCCAVVANGKFLAQHREAAAAATRALLKAAKWVDANPTAAAHISVDSKYVTVKVELDARALAQLKYIPSVSGAQNAVTLAATEMKKAGMLNDSTDVAALAARAFEKLDGVSDDWVDKLVVEKVAGGGPLPPLDAVAMAKLMASSRQDSCCLLGK